VEQIDDIVFRQNAVIEFSSKQEIRTKSINDRLKAVFGKYTLSFGF